MNSLLRRSLAAVGLTLAASAPALAQPALWRASSADAEVWMFGSVHVLPENLDWRTPALEAAIAEADYVYFEVPISDLTAPAMVQKTLELGFASDGKLLTDYLTSEQADQLKAVAGEYEIPYPQLLAMRPWMAATALSGAALMQQGLDPKSGVDVTLAAEVPDSKERAFETGEQQLHMMADWPDDVQARMLIDTITQLKDQPAVLDEMVSAWSNGEVDKLDDEITGDPSMDDEAVYKRLITDRNLNWTKTIEGLMRDDKKVLVIVGAAHLTGPEGVPALLAADGIKVERVQ